MRDTIKGLSLFLFFVFILSMQLSIAALAATPNGSMSLQNGDITVTWSSSGSSNGEKKSETSATFSAQSSMTSPKTNTITITNNTQVSGTLSFDFKVSGSGSCSLSGSNYSTVLASGASMTITIKGAQMMLVSDKSITLTNVKLETIDNTEVKIEYDSSLGSVLVDDVSVISNNPTVIDPGSYTITAQAAPGVNFVGWFAADGTLLYKSATYPSGVIKEDLNIQAVFCSESSNALFLVDNVLYSDLNDAIVAAGNNKTIILAATGVLPSGNYNIPSGVTLLVPRDSANTVNTTLPDDDGNSTYIEPTMYRNLTLAQGANITVNGAISIGGKIGTYMVDSNHPDLPPYVNGAPSGPLGYITMKGDSSITVNSGGNLYAWGFVTGSGTITVLSGGNVYEALQIRDYRGGDATSSMIKNSSRVFPFNQYYIQNIEAPLILEAGATESVGIAVSVTLAGSQKTNAVFIGSDSGLIRLTEGRITRRYDGSSDRMIYDLNGTVSFGNLNVEIQVAFLSSKIVINSADYVMPINSNMTLNANSGSNVTINQDLALLPGSVVNIQEGTICTMGTGKRLFVYDQDAWVTGYASLTGKLFNPVYYAPGRTYDRTSADLVDAVLCINGTLDATNGYVYTTASGANIYSTATGKMIVGALDETGYTYQGKQSGETMSYAEIPVTSAQLKHADGTYLSTADAKSKKEYFYNSAHGRWIADGHSNIGEGVVTDPTCTKEGAVTYECTCGYKYSDTIAATGHSYSEKYIEPTFEADGYTTFTCACGDSYSVTDEGSMLIAVASIGNMKYQTLNAALKAAQPGNTITLLNTPESDILFNKNVIVDLNGINYEITCHAGWYKVENADSTWTIREKISIFGTSVNVGDSLDLYFYIENADLNDDVSYAVIQNTTKGTDAITVKKEEWEAFESTYVRFCYSSIAGKEMADVIEVKLYDGAGNVINNTCTESIAAYALRTLNNETKASTPRTNLMYILVDMLNFGAYCQNHFGYNMSNLANANIAAYQDAYAGKTLEDYSDAAVTGPYEYVGTVSAENQLVFTFYINTITEENKTETPQTAIISYTDFYGNNRNKTLTFQYSDEKAMYYVDVDNIAFADGRQTITCNVTYSEGSTAVFTGSIEGYAAQQKKEGTLDVYVMMMRFVESARVYFAS